MVVFSKRQSQLESKSSQTYYSQQTDYIVAIHVFHLTSHAAACWLAACLASTVDSPFQLADPPVPSNAIYNEELVDHLNDQLRVSYHCNTVFCDYIYLGGSQQFPTSYCSTSQPSSRFNSHVSQQIVRYFSSIIST